MRQTGHGQELAQQNWEHSGRGLESAIASKKLASRESDRKRVIFPSGFGMVCVDDGLMDDSGVLVRQVRRRRSASEKRLIVEQTLVPGASVARVARAHGLNANVVFHWRREYREGELAETGLVPVVLTGDVASEAAPFSANESSIRIDLPGGVVISVEGNADLALVRTIVESLRA